MSFTAYILDVITDTIYPAKITIENGLFKEITPITLDEKYLVDVEGLKRLLQSHLMKNIWLMLKD